MVKYTFNIPSINNPDEVEKMLSSIKSQTYKNYEVIIVDASKDNRVKNIVKRFGFRYVHSTPGLPHQRNVGFGAAKGDWIIWLDSDHYINKNFLKELDKFIRHTNYK